MSLSAEEYREHLATTAVRAGFSFAGVVLPESHEVQVGRMRLHYLDWGNKHLPPMVFLHGGALTAHTWDLCCLALRDEYHCIALDQRGHGDSDWADDARLFDRRAIAGHQGLRRQAWARQVHPRRHVARCDQCARLCRRPPRAARRTGHHRRRPGDAPPRIEPHPRFCQFGRRKPSPSRRSSRRRLSSTRAATPRSCAAA